MTTKRATNPEFTDFIYIDELGRIYRARTTGDDVWFYYWNPDKHWVSLRIASPAEVLLARQHKLPDEIEDRLAGGVPFVRQTKRAQTPADVIKQNDAWCECKGWCDADASFRVLTGHHPACDKAADPLKEAKAIIKDLVAGIEAWGNEEDGVYPPLWNTYKRAKAVLGQYNIDTTNER